MNSKQVHRHGRAALCAVTLLAAFCRVPADAAIIEVGGGVQGCDIHLTGPIDEGDLPKLERAIQRLTSQQPTRIGAALCLDSPGGSYQEALRITKMMRERWYLATVVAEGSRCYSACAIIFMGGSAAREEDRVEVARTLHVRGSLGFHSPYLFDFNSESFKNESVAFTLKKIEETFKIGVKAVQDLVRLGESDADVMPTGLVLQMLSRGPGELYMIDTVGKALSISVELSGVPPSVRPTMQMLCNACMNYLHRKPLDARVRPLTSVQGERTCPPARWKGGKLRFDETDGTEFPFLCVVHRGRGGSLHITEESYGHGTLKGGGDAMRSWWMYPPDTAISSLPTLRSGTSGDVRRP